jgi:hypothetical protein
MTGSRSSQNTLKRKHLMHPKNIVYDDFATEYAAYASDREGKEIKDDSFSLCFS